MTEALELVRRVNSLMAKSHGASNEQLSGISQVNDRSGSAGHHHPARNAAGEETRVRPCATKRRAGEVCHRHGAGIPALMGLPSGPGCVAVALRKEMGGLVQSVPGQSDPAAAHGASDSRRIRCHPRNCVLPGGRRYQDVRCLPRDPSAQTQVHRLCSGASPRINASSMRARLATRARVCARCGGASGRCPPGR